jgi:hypothetical protein
VSTVARLRGSPTDPDAPRGNRHDLPPLTGVERLLLVVVGLDADPRMLRAAARLIAELDLAARERIRADLSA